MFGLVHFKPHKLSDGAFNGFVSDANVCRSDETVAPDECFFDSAHWPCLTLGLGGDENDVVDLEIRLFVVPFLALLKYW